MPTASGFLRPGPGAVPPGTIEKKKKSCGQGAASVDNDLNGGRTTPAVTEPMNTQFSVAQIETLRAEFAGIQTISVDRLPQLRSMFGKMQDETILQVAKAKINFLSKLAVNDCVRRGIWQ